jgi:hypothetical protein
MANQDRDNHREKVHQQRTSQVTCKRYPYQHYLLQEN